MKITALTLLLLLLISACGGGGGGSIAPLEAPNAVLPTADRLVIEALLSSCGSNDVDEALGIQGLLLALLGDGTTTPTLSITGINLLQASFSWAIDTDEDEQSDLTGTTQFKDANGSPTIPLANPLQLVNALSGDLSALGVLIQQMPAGTQILTTYSGSPSQLPVTAISGDLTLMLGVGGTLSRSSGSYLSETGTLCSTRLTWTDLDLSDVTAAGDIPTGTMGLSTTGPTDSLTGTLTLDGDNTATLEVSHNGGPVKTYSMDLTTGKLS